MKRRFELLAGCTTPPLSDRPLFGPYGRGLRQSPHGPLYLYLARPEMADAWVNGGPVPCVPARNHLGERAGTKTPDEVHQQRWDGASGRDLARIIQLEGRGFKNIRFTGCSINGRRVANTRIDDYDEDALLLCFSSKLDASVMCDLGKVCCVEILAFETLLKALEGNFPEVLYGYMQYTKGSERSHFIRNIEDRWMQEFRVVMPRQIKETWVTLSSGIARRIDLSLAA